jgi:putative effector of murein hydrolase
VSRRQAPPSQHRRRRAAHGIGTARAFSVNAEAGRFAGLAMGRHGILGAVLILLLVR